MKVTVTSARKTGCPWRSQTLEQVVSCWIDRASMVRECAAGDASNPGPGDAPESATRSPVSATSELRNCGDVISGISAETIVRVPGPREHCSVGRTTLFKVFCRDLMNKYRVSYAREKVY